MSRIFDVISESRREEVIRGLDQAAAIGRDYILLVVLSCIISTFGLVLNSGAVIIGAMLIAPLMSPILAVALALVRGDLDRLWRALVTLFLGVLVAAALSTGLGRLVSAGELNFLEELPPEILIRTEPTLFDLAIALAGGAAAAYALTQPHLSATLPGVAIATALMPPICVVGITLSQGRTALSGSALLLFLANFVAIVFASSVIFTAVGFGPIARARRRVVMPGAIVVASILLLLVAVPLAGFMVRIMNDARENATIRQTLMHELSLGSGSSLVGFKKERQQDYMNIVVTVRSSSRLTNTEAFRVQQEVAGRLQKPVALTLLLVPVTRLEPIAPPTHTPASQPAATAIPTPGPAVLPPTR